MRKIVLFFLVVCILICVLLLTWVLLTSTGPVNRKNYNKIQVGMTEKEVKVLLGSPSEDLPPLSYQDIHTDESTSRLLKNYPHTLRYWRSDKHMITVVFGPDGDVIGKSYSRDPAVGSMSRIIDMLGL